MKAQQGGGFVHRKQAEAEVVENLAITGPEFQGFLEDGRGPAVLVRHEESHGRLNKTVGTEVACRRLANVACADRPVWGAVRK